jgi:imidazole glycerol-phosphate synthase subunit HisH
MIDPSVVIVDYGIGNLFSVVGAVKAVGIESPVVSSDASEIESADRVILPGVGAFGDGMNNLRERDLALVLQDRTAADKPTLGVCLGMQLLMEESDEFGQHEGLGAIRGSVIRFAEQPNMKIPLIGWEPIMGSRAGGWKSSVLSELETGTHMYFVHSYYVKPASAENVLATTRFGESEFCSVVNEGNTTGVQFHPERSGEDGIQVYRNFLFGTG